MKYCKNCGRQLDDENEELCEECKREENVSAKKDIALGGVSSEKVVESQSKSSAPSSPVAPVVQPQKEKTSLDKKKKIIIGVIVAVVIVAAVVVLVLAVKSKTKKPETNVDSDTVVEVVSNAFGVPFTDENGENVTRVVKKSDLNKKEDLTNENGQKISEEQIQALREAPTQTSGNVGTHSPVVIETPAENNTPVNPVASEKALKLIEQFLSGTYYLDGVLYSGGEGNSMIMAVDKDNYDVLANIDSIELSICRYGEKFYMKRPASKQYCELNDSVMSMLGLTKDDISIPTGTYDVKSKSPKSISNVKVDGKDGVCYSYETSDSDIINFYVVGDKFIQIDTLSDTGALETSIKVNDFSGEIPSDKMTLKGYTSAPLGDMLADVLADES